MTIKLSGNEFSVSTRSAFQLLACFIVASGFIFFGSVASVNAQSPSSRRWTFVYTDRALPAPNWGCPYAVCDATHPTSTTKIAYASDYNYWVGNYSYNHLNPDLFATFSGGNLMGGTWQGQQCQYGMYGYGTNRYGNVGENCSGAPNEITVTFSQPIIGSILNFSGKYPQTLIVTESGQPAQTVTMDADGNYPPGSGIGIGRAYLSGKKISSLKIKSLDPSFAFSIEDIQVYDTVPYSPSAYNPPPDYCGVTAIAKPAPANQAAFGWTMHSEVSDADGLVLTDVRLNGRLMAERISVPYYKIETNTLPPMRGELRPNDASGDLRSRLVAYKPDVNDERLIITATYAIDNISTSQSCLVITQRYEFTKKGLNAPCEPNDSIPCQQYRALVNYKFTGNNGETLRSLNVAQRNHFTVNGANNNSVGLFRDCDNPAPPDGIGCLASFEGLIFKDKINPLFTEYYSPVIVNGKDNHLWDNMHQTFQGWVTEPPSDLVHWVLGGCPECLHTHWRWGANVPSSEHFGGGKILLPSDTNQDLSIGVVRNRASEEHPLDFSNLINSTNPESIRSPMTGNDDLLQAYDYTIPTDVAYWLLAKGYKDSDEFFSHYSFFNPDSPNVIRSISANTQPFSFTREQKKISVNSPTQDAPTSIVYGHLFNDGATTYRQIDPNTVAPLPDGYVAYNAVSYDVRTEAEASGPDTITFNLPSVVDQTTFSGLRILHSEPDPFDSRQAIWVDRTILSPGAPAPDFANRNISAKVNQIGPFVIASYTPPPPNTNIADLSVSISDSSNPITAGNQLTYTVNVTNSGNSATTGVVFNDGLSPDIVFVSAAAPQGTCREENATVICNLGTIASGATVPVTIIVEPNEGQSRFPSEGKSIVNTAFVRANEIDNDQTNNSATKTTNAMPNPNAPPSVQIQSPAAGAPVAGTAFSVIVNAADDGVVSQVELFDDGASVGNAAPLETGKYVLSLSNAAYGEHSLVAVATDDGGRKAVSSAVDFFVNGPAVVAINSPAEEALFGRPANIAITATAFNDSGSVSQVEFLADGESIGNGVLASGTNQYNLTWNGAPTGIHSLRAVATDGNGVKSYSESARIFVTNPPTVSITSPTSGTSITRPATVVLTANANDFDGYISKVEFFAGGTTYLGTGTLSQSNNIFTSTWTPTTAGTYAVTAVATDDWGKTSTSNPVNVTITNAAPSVSITAPASGASFTAPAAVALSANASDADGTVKKVQFYNGSSLLASILNPPYNFSWTNVPVGSYVLTAKATDNDDAITTSSAVTVTVNPVGNALLVVGNTTLSSVDTAIKTRLQNLGFSVVVKAATAAVSADATGKLVVVISDSVTATNVNTKFRAVSVPVVTLSSQLFDDMGMCATATTNFGTTTAQTSVSITNATHPMAAGLSGTIQVTSASTTFGWGKLNANAVKIATLTTDATKATDFAYEANAVMQGLTAPKRRVGFFYSASSASLTTNGGLLFDNAIKWAAGL